LVIGLDQILKMGCSKGKEGIWNQIKSGNPILVLIWIKPSVCVVQNLDKFDPKKQDYPDPNRGVGFQGGFQEENVVKLGQIIHLYHLVYILLFIFCT